MRDYKYLYINQSSNEIYVGLDELLDPSYNFIGETWEEYESGAWILLSEEQITFHEENPTANVEEVFNMEVGTDQSVPTPLPLDEPKPLDPLQSAKLRKLSEINYQDGFSNKFFVSVQSGGVEVKNQMFWLDKESRNSLLNLTLPALQKDGVKYTKLWTNDYVPESIDVPVDWAITNLLLVEMYAKRTYDIKSSNELAVYNAETIEEVESIDVSADYPYFLTFELNLDLNGNNN